MALSLSSLGRYCRPELLRPYEPGDEVFIVDGVDPYRSEGITKQFLEDAQVYHERYFKPGHFDELLSLAFQRGGLDFEGTTGLSVLDLGSGSGNTVIPLVRKNSSLELIATDLSVDLLRILAALVRDKEYSDRIGFVCADANKRVFHDNAFDVVVGASILHHLITPVDAVINALSSLRPGGLAIFFEPFEYGCNVMKDIYLMILDDPRTVKDLSPQMAASFMAMVRDYNARFDVDVVKPFTKYLDDKWLFTRKFFFDGAAQAGCVVVDILNSRIEVDTLFTSQVLTNLELCGLSVDAIPQWLVAIPQMFDEGIDASLKRQMIVDGVVILRKRE